MVIKKVKKKNVKAKKEERGENKTEWKVVNIAISSDLEHDIPLERVAATLPNTEYNPEQFPGLVLRIKEPNTTVLLFSSGKIVCTGAKSLDEVDLSLQNLIKILKKLNIIIKVKPVVKVQNMVASGNIYMELNLNSLAMKLPNTEYEPEQFPGLVFKLNEAGATFLLFSNGKIVCTGTKNVEQIGKSIKMLVEILKKNI